MEPTTDEPTPIPTGEKAGRTLPPSSGSEDDAEREFNEVRRFYQQDESAIDDLDLPDFPVSVQQYQQMSKASILQHFAHVHLCYSRVQRDLDSNRRISFKDRNASHSQAPEQNRVLS